MDRSAFLSNYKGLIPLSAILLLLVGLWPALEVLGARWLKFDESYSHGFLVLVVSLTVSVQKWLRLRPQVGLYPLWLLPLSLAALVYLAGGLLLMEALQQVALIPLLLGTLLVIWGWRQSLPFFLPVGIMAFTIPIWDYLSWTLQLITVSVNHFLLSFFDIDFFVEGVFVYFPGVGAFEIAHGCSGLRYLLVGLTLTVLYGELNLARVKTRALLLAVGVALALLANWIRVFVIIYVGYESNMTSSLINEHDFFGWWVFAATLVPLFLFARWLERLESASATERPLAVQSQVGNTGLAAVLLIVFVPLALFSAAALKIESRTDAAEPSGAVALEPLLERAEWLPLFESSLDDWAPIIRKPDHSRVDVLLEREGAKQDAASAVRALTGLYVYEFQRPGKELVSYQNKLFDSQLFLPQTSFDVSAGQGITLRGMVLKRRHSSSYLYVAYGYFVEGRWESDELRAKLAQLPGILNQRSDASLLVLGIVCEQCDGVSRLNALMPGVRMKAERQVERLIR